VIGLLAPSQLSPKANLTLTLSHNPNADSNPLPVHDPNTNPNSNLGAKFTWGRVDCHLTGFVCQCPAELLHINDQLNNVALRYERFERMRSGGVSAATASQSQAASSTPPVSPSVCCTCCCFVWVIYNSFTLIGHASGVIVSMLHCHTDVSVLILG